MAIAVAIASTAVLGGVARGDTARGGFTTDVDPKPPVPQCQPPNDCGDNDDAPEPQPQPRPK